MSTFDLFVDYDDARHYKEAREGAAQRDAKNFVVDFGSRMSRIASNVPPSGFKTLMTEGAAPRTKGAPTRWINVWAPDSQPDVVKAIGDRYGFSKRLVALLLTTPPPSSREAPAENWTPEKELDSSGADIEKASPVRPTHLDRTLKEVKPNTTNFFNIATNFSSYQSIDIGDKFICIGANWMHPVEGDSGIIEPERLWSWLVLCHDDTVISFHEAPRPKGVVSKYIETVRKNTLSVLSQLSTIGSADGVELISLRQPAESNDTSELTGVEGASNLFYYLFDDWTATYTLLMVLQGNIEKLRQKIMAGLGENQPDALAKEIIPKLYEVGKLLRSNQHLFSGYENLISRILKYEEDKEKEPSHGRPDERVSVVQTARHRFERLRDNIKFLVLNYVDEAIGEIEGLQNTYFNITTQKDSMATAKLNSSATLLSKLGVLFLPVSLMTSYFSVQIKELDGVYTVKTYWVTFAVVMVLSFVALFMFSRVLVGAGTAVAKRVDRVVDRVTGRIGKGGSPNRTREQERRTGESG